MKKGMRLVTSGVPQGLVLGPMLFNIFVSYSRIERTLSKFAVCTKFRGVVGTLKRSNAMQRDCYRFERWAHANLMEFSKAKCTWVKAI